jgi:hypothetical protein
MAPLQRAATVMAPILVAAYAAPIWIIAFASLIGQFTGASIVGKWFVALVIAPDSALNLFQKVLLPITAGVTVGVMWKAENQRWTLFMAGFVLASVILSVYLYVLLGIPQVQADLWQLAENDKVNSSDQMGLLATTFLGRMQESLATYLLILLGLQAIPKTKEDGK